MKSVWTAQAQSARRDITAEGKLFLEEAREVLKRTSLDLLN